MRRALEIKEGAVYLPRNARSRYAFRRVIAVLGGKVVYSAGGDRNHTCSLAAFRRSVRARRDCDWWANGDLHLLP